MVPFRFSILLVAALALGACAHSGSSSISGGGSTVPPPPPPPPPPSFTSDDLMGDWVGQITPDNPARQTQNVYLRFASGQLVEAADSAGNEWTLAGSDRRFDFNSAGVLRAEMALLIGVSSLTVQAQMDAARAVLSGTTVQVGGDLFPVPGTIELTRSAAGTFTADLLQGDWEGAGVNPSGRHQDLFFELDALGGVLSGRMQRPDGRVRRTYAPGATTFAFADDAIGRLDDVVMVSDGGVTLAFHYLLLAPGGTLLAGPGTDGQLGAGLVRLTPATAAD